MDALDVLAVGLEAMEAAKLQPPLIGHPRTLLMEHVTSEKLAIVHGPALPGGVPGAIQS